MVYLQVIMDVGHVRSELESLEQGRLSLLVAALRTQHTAQVSKCCKNKKEKRVALVKRYIN